MKKLTIAFASVFFTINASAQVKMPPPSPAQTIKQEFGIGSIELTYSRPGTKGRKVFGDLVPYDKLWRTGANAATKLVFTEPVEVNNKKIDSGAYALYTIPGIETWEIILNKGIGNWGIDGYKESEDVIRFKIIPVKQKTITETFTMQFTNITPESCTLQILWEKTLVNIPITTNFKDKVKQQIEAAMQTDNAQPTGSSGHPAEKPYWQAAQFYNEYEKNLPKALENVTKAADAEPKAFWILLYKAKIQKEMGDVTGAMETSKKSKQLAKEAGNDDYVRMNEKLQKELKE